MSMDLSIYLGVAVSVSLISKPGVSAYLFLVLIYSFLLHTHAPTQRTSLRGFVASSLTFIELPSLSSLLSHSHYMCAGIEAERAVH